MAGGVKGIPDGASVIIPRLFCREVAGAIDFCKDTFGAVERVRRPGRDGTVAHALMPIGPAMIMIEGEWPGVASRAPKPDGSSPVVIYVPTNRITEILNGQRAITGDTALRLGHFFGTSAEFWLNLQSLYELRLAEHKAGKAIKILPTLKDREPVHA